MKAKQIEQLQSDLIKYSKQIGILDSEIPRLITNRKEYQQLKVKYGESKRSAGYGECHCLLRTIFVDCGVRTYQHVEYRKKLPQELWFGHNKDYFAKRAHNAKKYRICKNVKAAYRDKLHCLVHELTHYRFKYLGHGPKFEARIREIFAGKQFPLKSIDNAPTITEA